MVTGRMLDERLGRIHFWITFLGTYAIYFPMHYLGVMGMPRRYYEYANYAFIPASAHTLNAFITVVALIVGAAQLLFVYNLLWSAWRGRRAEPNPWRAASLEWATPHTPPRHGNWGPQLPVVHRWAYAYSVPGAAPWAWSARCSVCSSSPTRCAWRRPTGRRSECRPSCG